MKINRLIHISAGALLGLLATGCSEADEPGLTPSAEDYILFSRPWINPDATVGDFATGGSRASLATAVEEFDVWGYCVPRSVSNSNQLNQDAAPLDWNRKANYFTAGSDVFTKNRVKVDGSFTDYKSSIDLRSWNSDEEARYTFVGTSVHDPSVATFTMEKSSATSTSPHGPQLTFTLGANGSALTSPLDYTKQPDALLAATFDHQKADGRVPMSFAHIMVGLRFKFHNFTDDKDLVITKVTFSGEFYKQVMVDFSSDKPDFTVTGATYKGTFTLLDKPQTISASSADLMGTDTHPVTLLLLPNRHPVLNPDAGHDKELVLGNSKTISISYRIGDKENTYTLPNFELNYIPQENSLHTAHFNFVGDKFVVLFQADNNTQWADGSDTEVDIK